MALSAYVCRYGCGATFYTRSARDAHEENCENNPHNESTED